MPPKGFVLHLTIGWKVRLTSARKVLLDSKKMFIGNEVNEHFKQNKGDKELDSFLEKVSTAYI